MRAMRAVTAATALVGMVSACASYGAHFGFPDAPPPPAGASVAIEDTATDDDDPLRARVQVVSDDIHPWATVAEHYRQTFPETQGWSVEISRPAHLCLVNHQQDDRVDVVEVRPYAGTLSAPGERRYLVTSSRFASEWGGCGQADAWIDPDLLAAPSEVTAPSASP